VTKQNHNDGVDGGCAEAETSSASIERDTVERSVFIIARVASRLIARRHVRPFLNLLLSSRQ
jgi:hypothetical protein